MKVGALIKSSGELLLGGGEEQTKFCIWTIHNLNFKLGIFMLMEGKKFICTPFVHPMRQIVLPENLFCHLFPLGVAGINRNSSPIPTEGAPDRAQSSPMNRSPSVYGSTNLNPSMSATLRKCSDEDK